jgi:hypothetical protein
VRFSGGGVHTGPIPRSYRACIKQQPNYSCLHRERTQKTMPGDDQDMEGELPTAVNGQPTKAFDKTPTQTGTASNRKASSARSPGTTNEQAVLDWMNYQPDADHIYSDRDGSLRHLAQPEALRSLSSPGGIDRVHTAVNGNGHATVKQQPIVGAAARQPQAVALAPTDQTPFAFAGLALLLGYAWLLAGVDKLLLGTFPAQLAQILSGTLRGSTLPGFFAGFLRAVVLPNGAIFGFTVEYAETLAGLGLIAASLAIFLAPLLERRVAPPLAQRIVRLRRLLVALGVLAAIGTVLLGVTYFLLDGTPSQFFMPSVAFDGALDPGLQLALGSLVLLMAAVLGGEQRRSRQHQLATQPVRRDESNSRK